jgi:hypothetical protein
MGTPQGLEVYMKNGLLRFYLLFMVMSLALFSCENHEITNHWGTTDTNIPTSIQRKPEGRHPVEPNDSPAESQKSSKKPRRQYIARSSNWC